MPGKKSKKNKQERKSADKTLSIGVVFLSLALIFLSAFLFIKSKNAVTYDSQTQKGQPNLAEDTNEIYFDENLGYSIAYPPFLEPRTITQNNFLSLIVFFVPEGYGADGFAISVSENSLEDEINLIKNNIGEGVAAKLLSEGEFKQGGYSGWKMEYEPENEEEGEPRTIVVINNGKYSYSLSASPSNIEEVLAGFSLLN